jgi:NDP-sugar pyrophosphorylase family protein
MKAMVLAAGLGTRLRPLTDTRPKALVEIGGRTLLEITLTRLRAFGVEEVIINVHHLADRITEYLAANRNFGMRIEVSREDALLDTGGGLKKAGWFFLDDARNGGDEPFLLHNVDVISSIDLGRLVEAHRSSKALATLAVQKRDASRQLLFDEHLQLCGRRAGRDNDPEIVRASPNLQALAFTGIHVLSPRFLRSMTEQGVFSIIDLHVRLAGEGEHIQGRRVDEFYWRDLGKPEQLQQAEQDYRQGLFT